MTTDMTQITKTPITNDELAGLIIGGNGANAQMITLFANKIDEFLTAKLKEQSALSAELINNQAKALQRFEDIMSAQNEQIKKQSEIITKLESIMRKDSVYTTSSSYNLADVSKWTKSTWDTINAISPRLGIPAKSICGKIYDLIYKKYGTDVRMLHQLYKEHNKGSIFTMCAYDDNLRPKFDASLKELCSTVKYESFEVRKIPDSIRRDCLAIAPDKPVNITFKKVLKKMGEISGMNIDNFILKNAYQVKYARFSKSYFISKSKILSTIYKQAVKEMLNSSVSNAEV